MNKTRALSAMAVFAATLLLITATAPAQSFLAPPETLPGGLSYQQWGAKWWQWVLSIPASINPILDTTGANCDVDQSGPVWFLAGGPPIAERNCTVPAGKMIFFPIINLVNDYPCQGSGNTPPRRNPDFQPGPGQSLEQFLTTGYGTIPGARQFLDHVTALTGTLDGVPIVPAQDLPLPPELSKYRATSPIFVFNGDRSLSTPDGFGDPCIGPGHKAVTDGYWIMLKPLPAGSHTLFFTGTETYPPGSFGGSFTVAATYHLTIE
jgi:hypothetical protein